MPRKSREDMAQAAIRRTPPVAHGTCSHCRARVPLSDVGSELLAARHCLPHHMRAVVAAYEECPGTGLPPDGRATLSNVRP